MLKLKNIKSDNCIISCDIYPEDSTEAGYMRYDLKKDKVLQFDLPKGYEWCERDSAQAVQYFRNTDITNLPKEKTLIWF